MFSYIRKSCIFAIKIYLIIYTKITYNSIDTIKMKQKRKNGKAFC